MDVTLLRTFVTVAQMQNFTAAGARIGLSQSTVSQHIRKLERMAGRRLLDRDTHSVALTAEGEAMLGFARSILESHERAERYFSGSELRGRVRLGVGEDLLLTRLPEILHEFVSANPQVDLELTVGLSGYLYDRLAAQELDLVFAKRRPGEERGRLIRREKLAWLAAKGFRHDPTQPVTLIVYQGPSITRDQAIRALDAAGLPWRIVCTSGSFNGLMAATLAGLGVTGQARSFVPAGLVDVTAGMGLPDLGETEFVVVERKGGARSLARALASIIQANSGRGN
jgi:DNA-binding transcriptional LysR family regulator